jgi:hypothetical protein
MLKRDVNIAVCFHFCVNDAASIAEARDEIEKLYR